MSRESTEPSTQNMETAENYSDSVMFMDISNPDMDQVAVKNNSMGNGESNTSTQSRFILEFDSIMHLGNGGFGSVFKAREKRVDTYYAVKVVQFTGKALREVKALSDLHHRNIVQYFNCWEQDSDYQDDSSVESSTSSESVSHSSPMYLYIKMELCDTRTLESWIMERNVEHQQDSERREESLNIAQQIVSGVKYIHFKKLIHRDLKPSNIMFGQNKKVKIVDFGLVTTEADDNDNLMERTNKTGTISYMAPEQHGKTYDRKVDIFALGLIYLELLWKVSTGSERAAIFMDARRKKFPTQFTSEFFQEDHIIKSMLHEKPGDRPEATDLKTELKNLSRILSAQKATASCPLA
ncbi:interferon-induced, double-stranded RNA-activated protein kinase-like isoform X2 [Solea solea]|uniref:interferon-induced, double-stranded RNA-activated protein kinase-like isoform X2 n=1 Tax=Solea solea TaxID=90069 RepID=UPI00272ACB62|nr:interferon-induced, double-stranded RNA-activated protein kinase-like isoform X2 [Solea solea]